MTYVIAPSILSANFAKLGEDVLSVAHAGADWIHVDVMDGAFVPNITIGQPVVAALKRITDLPLDVHLMIEKPERFVDSFIDAGADVVTVHAEASIHLHRTLQQIRSRGALAGVSLNPHTPIHVLDHILPDLDLILVMSVNPGFGGQSFIPSALDKIQAIRARIDAAGLPIRLEVDGGVKPSNIRDIANAGADTFVAGSAIFAHDDVSQPMRALRDALA